MRNVPSCHHEPFLLPEERLLLDAAEMPVLSPGLRARVLNAAVETECRQAFGRRALWAAGVLFAAMGLMAWRGPLTSVRDDFARAAVPEDRASVVFRPETPRPETPQPAIIVQAPDQSRVRSAGLSRRYGTGEQLMSAAGDDWRLVEAELQSRRESFRQIIRM
jgi:hypothetical protein